MVIYGERFDYSDVRLTEEQRHVARCRAEAARRGRLQARRWATRRRQAQALVEGPSARPGMCYRAEYHIVQYIHAQFIDGQMEHDASLRLFSLI